MNTTNRTRTKLAALTALAAVTLTSCFSDTTINAYAVGCAGTAAKYNVYVGANVAQPSTKWRVTSATGATFSTTWKPSGTVLLYEGTAYGENRDIVVKITTDRGVNSTLYATVNNSCN